MRSVLLSVVVVLGLVSLSYCVGTLYGLDNKIARLIKVNPENAHESPVGRHEYPKELLPQGVSSIDIQRKIYYSIAFNETDSATYLLGFSLKSGAVVSHVKLPYATSAFVGSGQFVAVIPGTSQVLTVGRDRVRNRYHLLEVNTTNGHTQVIGSFSVFADVLAGAAAYDPVHDVFWFQIGTRAGINNYAYNIKSRKQVYNGTDVDSIETMNYDEKTRKIVGIGIKSGGRALVSLDPTNGHTTVIAKIPSFWIINAQISALDEEHRILYSYLQPREPEHAPFQLVGVNIDNGHVVSSPAAGHANSLPDSLAFDPTL